MTNTDVLRSTEWHGDSRGTIRDHTDDSHQHGTQLFQDIRKYANTADHKRPTNLHSTDGSAQSWTKDRAVGSTQLIAGRNTSVDQIPNHPMAHSCSIDRGYLTLRHAQDLSLNHARRPRHKTKDDKYEFKAERKSNAKRVKYQMQRNIQDNRRVRTVSRKRKGLVLREIFTAPNVITERLTLTQSKTPGFLSKAKASRLLEGSDVPDLYFPRMPDASRRKDKKHLHAATAVCQTRSEDRSKDILEHYPVDLFPQKNIATSAPGLSHRPDSQAGRSHTQKRMGPGNKDTTTVNLPVTYPKKLDRRNLRYDPPVSSGLKFGLLNSDNESCVSWPTSPNSSHQDETWLNRSADDWIGGQDLRALKKDSVVHDQQDMRIRAKSCSSQTTDRWLKAFTKQALIGSCPGVWRSKSAAQSEGCDLSLEDLKHLAGRLLVSAPKSWSQRHNDDLVESRTAQDARIQDRRDSLRHSRPAASMRSDDPSVREGPMSRNVFRDQHTEQMPTMSSSKMSSNEQNASPRLSDRCRQAVLDNVSQSQLHSDRFFIAEDESGGGCSTRAHRAQADNSPPSYMHPIHQNSSYSTDSHLPQLMDSWETWTEELLDDGIMPVITQSAGNPVLQCPQEELLYRRAAETSSLDTNKQASCPAFVSNSWSNLALQEHDLDRHQNTYNNGILSHTAQSTDVFEKSRVRHREQYDQCTSNDRENFEDFSDATPIIDTGLFDGYSRPYLLF